MHFIDETKIFVKSGDGGHGCISFRHEKYAPRGGPDGGNGGDGGSVVLLVNEGASLNLYDLQSIKHFRARKGGNGGGADCHGKNGGDLIVEVPPGTMVFDENKSLMLADLSLPGARFVAAKGGRGGRGNATYATSTNRAPRQAEDGHEGEERWLILELKMIADVGLLGLPSVGKSTLITALSRARPKIAAYPFTTLNPNLGTVDRDVDRRFVVADLPGLIEGAHEGAGLGHKFLRHVERTRVLVHMIDMDPDNGRDPIEDFETINNELRLYNEKMLEKPQIVAANKMDLAGAKDKLKACKRKFARRKITVIPISAGDGWGMKELIDAVEIILKQDQEKT